MNQNNTVSAIVPNYNHAPFLNERITSIINQSKSPDEIIILDDKSADDSLQVINSFKTNELVKKIEANAINSGSVFKQWQKGITISSGSIIWIAESDDFCKPDFLEKAIKAFEDPEIVLAYARSMDVDEYGKAIGLSYSQFEWCDHSFVKNGMDEIKEHLYYQCTIPNVSAVIFRRSAVDLSFLQHNYKLCGDWFFYLKFLQKGKIAYFNEPLNCHRFHTNTVRNKQLNNYKLVLERLDIINKIRKDCGFSFRAYCRSAYFQIRLFLLQTKLKDIFSKNFLRAIIGITKYNPVFTLFAVYATIIRLFKTIIKR